MPRQAVTAQRDWPCVRQRTDGRRHSLYKGSRCPAETHTAATLQAAPATIERSSMSSSVTNPATGSTGLPPFNEAGEPRVNGTGHDAGNGIGVGDWDLMFDAVQARLLRTVGERLGELPEVPQHSAELAASLVQAVVLDCVNALGRLHAALEQERRQRPTS